MITESELLDALASASNTPADARSVHELVAATGLSEKRIRTALKILQRAGRLGVHRVTRTDLCGRPQQVPAYTILPK